MEEGESDFGRDLWAATVRQVRRDVAAGYPLPQQRIALARELLAGTGWVVAREVATPRMREVGAWVAVDVSSSPEGEHVSQDSAAEIWAAMMGERE